MSDLIRLVLGNIDQKRLDTLLAQLRTLDTELDMKMLDIRAAQDNITTLDRINIFTNSDAELVLNEENRIYAQIREEHGNVVAQIKDLIREAIYRDTGLTMKIQAGAVATAFSRLKVEHKWGIGSRTYNYSIKGAGELRGEITRMEKMIDAHFGFAPEPVDTGHLMHVVYDEVLRRNGFIE